MEAATESEDVSEIGRVLTNLYGLEVSSKATPDATLTNVGAIATYVNDNGDVHGHIVCDVAASATLGAALTQIPKGAVKEAVTSRKLPQNLRENLSEVLNISVNLFPQEPNLRLVLRDVEFDDQIAAKAKKLKPKTVVELDIERYGNGKIFFSVQN